MVEEVREPKTPDSHLALCLFSVASVIFEEGRRCQNLLRQRLSTFCFSTFMLPSKVDFRWHFGPKGIFLQLPKATEDRLETRLSSTCLLALFHDSLSSRDPS